MCYAAVGIGFYVLSVAITVYRSTSCAIKFVIVVTCMQAKWRDHAILHIAVETHTRHFLEDSACEVEVQIRVVVASTWRIIVIGGSAVAIHSRIDMIERGIILWVTETGCVRKHHAQCDRHLWVIWVTHWEANEITHIIIKRDNTFLHELHQGCSGERLGDGCDTHEMISSQRRLAIDIGITKGFFIDDLPILDDDSSDTYCLVVVHHLLNSLIGTFLCAWSATHHHLHHGC